MTLRRLAATTFGTLLVAAVLVLSLTVAPPEVQSGVRQAKDTVAVRFAEGVTEWLKEPVQRALEDARDPRPRK